MIILLVPEDEEEIAVREAEEQRARVLAAFAEKIDAMVPFGHRHDLSWRERLPERVICGEHGRVQPSRQGLCPYCGGYVEDAEALDAIARLGRSGGMWDAAEAARRRMTPFFHPTAGGGI